jgi:two-component system, NarL family, sensor histidine kinase DesK
MAVRRAALAEMFASRAVEDCLDPQAAPGAFKGPDPAPPRTFRRAMQNMFWFYVAGLVFFAFSVPQLIENARTTTALVLQLILLGAIAVAYVGAAWAADAALGARWLYVLGFCGLLVLLAPWWGWAFVHLCVYVSILLATLIPWAQARIAIVVVNVAVAAVAPLSGTPTPLYIALIGVMVALSTGAGIEAGRIGARLHRAEQRASALALAAERERIGRDLHDILGHSLTAISIKADLAARLIERDPTAAHTEITELGVIARQSLADVRATASAIREVRVADELASARSVLPAAGIEASVPTALDPVSDATSELFGYVVREAVTNVVRHSDATRCVITVEPHRVVVTDNGKGWSEQDGHGSGLRGLSDRVAAAGGVLTVGPAPSGGTRVAAETGVLAERASDRIEVAGQ